MAKCLDAYRAAAALGSAEAEYGVALFYMNGGTVVPQDLKEGTMRLRSAAETVPSPLWTGLLVCRDDSSAVSSPIRPELGPTSSTCPAKLRSRSVL